MAYLISLLISAFLIIGFLIFTVYTIATYGFIFYIEALFVLIVIFEGIVVTVAVILDFASWIYNTFFK